MAKVIMTCGKICCGKTTYANRLKEEMNAVILSIDEITLTLFPEGAREMHDTYALRAEQYLLKFPCDLQPRFDVAEVEYSGSFVRQIEYLESAFDATGY